MERLFETIRHLDVTLMRLVAPTSLSVDPSNPVAEIILPVPRLDKKRAARGRPTLFDSYRVQGYNVRAMDDDTLRARSPLACTRQAVVACATVIEEMRPHLPAGTRCQVLDFGLHVQPQKLKQVLQETIDVLAAEADTILLGYGLCSMAIVGLVARGCTLVVPKVDDCIALFLGSGAVYREQSRREPGTYYLTKGWIEAGDHPFSEYDRLVERYGEEKARWLMAKLLHNYTRLALIDTGQYEIERYRAYSQQLAARFGLRYQEIGGSNALILKMLHGPWDGDFLVAQPGETIVYLDFVEDPVAQDEESA